MDKKRRGHFCAVITSSSTSGNVVLVCGGVHRSDCEIYDPATNSWTNGPSLPSTLEYSAMVTASRNSMYDAFILGGLEEPNSIYGVKDLTTITLVGTLHKSRQDLVALKVKNLCQ